MADLLTSLVEVSLSGGVGHIEICRPEKKNAMTSAMGEDLLRALRRLEDDLGCNAVVISGRGGDLSSGADLDEPRDQAMTEQTWANAPHARLLRAIAGARIPVIAAVDGWAIGLGLGVGGAATHVVAGRGSRFSLPEIRSGYLPYAVLPHLVYRVAPATILQWAVSGTVFTLDEASAAGLVTHVADAGRAVQAAQELAAPFSAASRDVVEQGMAFVRECRSLAGAPTIVGWCERQMDAVLAQGGGGGTSE